mgnify:CR=1 FL=1
MHERGSLPMVDAEIEVDRYTVWPGQALAYKLGQREIERARVEVSEAMGDRFDLRAFHDEDLGRQSVRCREKVLAFEPPPHQRGDNDHADQDPGRGGGQRRVGHQQQASWRGQGSQRLKQFMGFGAFVAGETRDFQVDMMSLTLDIVGRTLLYPTDDDVSSAVATAVSKSAP